MTRADRWGRRVHAMLVMAALVGLALGAVVPASPPDAPGGRNAPVAVADPADIVPTGPDRSPSSPPSPRPSPPAPPGERDPLVGALAIGTMVVAGAAGLWIYSVIRKGL